MDLNDLKGFIVALTIVAMLGAVTSIALDDFRENDRPTGTVTHEQATITAGTPASLANPYVTSITSVYNSSDHLLSSSEYSLLNSGLESSQLNITNTSYGATTGWNVTYNFYELNYQWNISTNGLVGVSNSTNYMNATGTLVGVAVLIGIVVIAFGMLRR